MVILSYLVEDGSRGINFTKQGTKEYSNCNLEEFFFFCYMIFTCADVVEVANFLTTFVLKYMTLSTFSFV
jgi:hypothetical protein